MARLTEEEIVQILTYFIEGDDFQNTELLSIAGKASGNTPDPNPVSSGLPFPALQTRIDNPAIALSQDWLVRAFTYNRRVRMLLANTKTYPDNPVLGETRYGLATNPHGILRVKRRLAIANFEDNVIYFLKPNELNGLPEGSDYVINDEADFDVQMAIVAAAPNPEHALPENVHGQTMFMAANGINTFIYVVYSVYTADPVTKFSTSYEESIVVKLRVLDGLSENGYPQLEEGYNSFKRENQTVTLRVNSRTTTYEVRPRVKPGTSFYVNEYTYTSLKHQTNEVKPAYIKGKDFDLDESNLKAKFFHSSSGFDLILTPGNGLYPEDVKDYDKNKAGKQTLTVDLDGVAKTFPVYVLDAQSDVWFDYGFMRHVGDPEGAGAGFGKYHVEQGKTLVLAPGHYLIGWNDDHTPASGTTYSWTVEGGGYDTAQPHNGEFFTFKPTAAGTYTVCVTVSGRGYVDGTTITKTAETQAVSFASGTKGETKTWGKGNANKCTLKNFAPGQYTGSGNGYGWSLGSIGGYAVWTDTHREVYAVGGNEFGTWFEPGIVWLQEDNNGNGVPDEMWYEVKGPSDLKEQYRALITRRYVIRWLGGNDGSQINKYGQINTQPLLGGLQGAQRPSPGRVSPRLGSYGGLGDVYLHTHR